MFPEKAAHQTRYKDKEKCHEECSEQWSIVHDVLVVEGKWVR